MAKRRFVPERGDVVWLQFNPQAGHDQAGHRPALVLSPALYNQRTGLMLCCPITRRVKGYPFEVGVPMQGGVEGIVLRDQVKSLDWIVRRAKKKGKASSIVVDEVLVKARTLL